MRNRKLKELKERRVCNKRAPRWIPGKYNVVSTGVMKTIKADNEEVLFNYTPSQLRAIAKEFNEYMVEFMVTNRDYVELPYMIGDIWIAVFGKGGKVSLPMSDNIQKEVKFRNSETDGYGIKFFYTADYKYTKTALYRHIWEVKPCRNVGLRIKEEVERGNWKNFMVTKPTYYLKNTIKALKAKSAHLTYKKHEFAEYDEFYINEETED